MNLSIPLTIISTILFCHTLPASDSQSAATMLSRIQAYHEGSAGNDHVLRVIYFHPADTPPQKDYQAHLTRIMLDIQQFYRHEMQRNGFGARSFPLEMHDDQLVIHVVEGREKAGAYDYRSGGRIAHELQLALAGKVDVRNEYVLIFHGLCEKLGDNRYRFFAPYYGDGSSNQRRGLCHAADCEQMDTLLMEDRKTRFFYDEHTGKFRRTLGAFNCLYIGGVAHELGHALGLPHNREQADETASRGTALMGSGNYTYRHERWGEQGSFLTPASAARLASHPLFSGSDRGRWDRLRCQAEDLAFANADGGLRITGRIAASLPAYAVIAYSDPDGGSDYDARTWIEPVADQTFQLTIHDPRPAQHELRLVFCFPNGATAGTKLRYEVDANGGVAAEELNDRWQLSRIEQDFLQGRRQQAIASAKARLPEVAGTPTEQKLRHLIAMSVPNQPMDLEDANGDAVFLSDVNWTEAETGWGSPTRNLYCISRNVRDAVFLEMANQFYSKGLYAHAPSRYVFRLDRKWQTFEAVGGLQSGAASIGSAVFIVKADGRECYRSPLLSGSTTVDIRVDVSGVDTLELLTESGKDGNASCWSIWGNPRVGR